LKNDLIRETSSDRAYEDSLSDVKKFLQWLASNKFLDENVSVRGRWTMGTNFHLTNTDERFPQEHKLGLKLSLNW